MDVAEELKRNGGDFIEINSERDVQEEIQEEHSSELGIDSVDSAGDDRKHRDDRVSLPGKIFVGGVSWDTTEEIFTKHFEKYGEIIDSVIMKEKHSRRPRGFGFITFADPSVLDKVLEDEHVINGRTVEVKRTVAREDMQVGGSQKTKKIFVGGIPPIITEDELKEYFSSYGNIVEHQILLDHNSGRSRGFGFVTFDNEEVVEAIINESKTHELGGKQVEIKKAEPKRGGGDHGSNAMDRFGGGFASSYGNYGAGAHGYSNGYKSFGGYGGRSARGYGGYGAGTGGFYDGYGGYGYRAGYGGPTYGNAEYGDDWYGSSGGYGGGYSGAASYGGYGGAYGGGGVGGRGYGMDAGARGRYHPYGR